MISVALLVSVAAWSCDDENATTRLVKRELQDPLAVCNDGTRAAYYYSAGDDTVLIYLGGGGQCWDATSCMERFNGSAYPYHDCRNSSIEAPCYLSSKDYPETCNKTGIFSENPLNPVATATKVYVPYCSSDAHVGDAEFAGWQFRGKRIVAAVLADFEGRPIVFGGGSAGGRGALLWLDHVPNSVGFLDSPYYLDLEPYNSSFVGFPTMAKEAYANFNITIDDQCRQAYFQEPWKCTLGQYALDFMKTPRLVVAAQYDAWQLSNAVLGYNGIATDPDFDTDQLTYVTAFGNATRALLSVASLMVFAPACFAHHTSEKEDFWTATTLDGATQAASLLALLSGDRLDHIDLCGSYNCGAC